MARPTTQERWDTFTGQCSRIGLNWSNPRDLENFVSDSILSEEIAGIGAPDPTEIERRTDRFGDARKYFENHTSQLASKKNSVIAVLSEIMGLEKRYSVSKDYCTATAASFLEALPYLLDEREFGGADHGVNQIPVYSLDLILKAAQMELSEFKDKLELRGVPDDQKAAALTEIAGKLMQSFSLERYTAPMDPNYPRRYKSLEVIGLTGNFYTILYEAKLGERQDDFEERKLNRKITILLAANLIAFAAGETYLSANGYSGEDLGDITADAVYDPLPKSNITGGEAVKAGVPKKRKRFVPATEERSAEETLIPGDGCQPGCGLPAPTCPRNLQREYFTRLVKVENGASEEKIQTIIDDFRAGITFDYVITDGSSVVELMLGPRDSYESLVFQQSYDDVSKTVKSLVGSGKVHLYTPNRKQDPGTLILQPAPNSSSRGGK